MCVCVCVCVCVCEREREREREREGEREGEGEGVSISQAASHCIVQQLTEELAFGYSLSNHGRPMNCAIYSGNGVGGGGGVGGGVGDFGGSGVGVRGGLKCSHSSQFTLYVCT